jgi:flavin reductase (DIM6/NTAB) family NADH-FMN oxidoreductase RutF
MKMNTQVNGVSKQRFVTAMRDVASSVTVVTTDGHAGCHGATVSAFCPVSDAPPTVLVCLNAGSRIADKVGTNQNFCLNVINQEHHHLIQRFSGGDDEWLADRFDGIKLNQPVQGHAPALADCIALVCDVVRIVHQHSHIVVFGEVTHIIQPETTPIVYVHGAVQCLNRLANFEQTCHAPEY